MSLISQQFIENDAVNQLKFRIDNDQWVRGRNAANTADINLFKLNTSNQIEFSLIPYAPGTPTNDNQLVNLGFLKAFVDGVRDPKQGCRVASLVNVPLTGSTPLVIDGITMINADRVLLAGQTSGAQNGIYSVNITGGTYTLSRSSDANESSEVTQGMSTVISLGTVNGKKQFILTTDDPIILDTTVLTFVDIPSVPVYTGGDMISVVGTDIKVDLATVSGLESTSPGTSGGQLRVKVSANAVVRFRTTKINASNEIEGLKGMVTAFTLGASDITNQYIDLAYIAADNTIGFHPKGGPKQHEGLDYSLNYTGGVGGNTRIAFLGDLATGGSAALKSGNVVYIYFQYL